jgi:acetyl-CoA/propionyl-CoA carboxylase biotin carboxyl carrier protein
VIVHGPDREAARRALVDALDDTAILGLTTNVGFLRVLAASDEFRDASIDTAWLDTATVAEPGLDTARIFAAWTEAFVVTSVQGDDQHPFRSDGFRLGTHPAPVIVDLDRTVVVDNGAGLVDGVPVRPLSAERHVVVLSIDGRREQAVVNVQSHFVEVVHHGHRRVFTRPDVFAGAQADAGDGSVTAPMPGTVLSVSAEEGDEVAEGDVLGIMEAMKMELSLTAPFAGAVTKVAAETGSQVKLGAELFVVTPDDSDGSA